MILGGVAPSVGAASDPPGHGHSSGGTSLLTVSLGDAELSLALVTEEAHVSTEPGASTPSATERVAPLGVASSLVPGLAALSQPAIETHHTSGEDTAVTPGVDLAALVAGGPVPGLLSGTVDPVTLRSAVGADGAVSAATGAVRDLRVLGGLLSVDLVEAVLGAAARNDAAEADRHVQVDEVVALHLGALLASLGISLGDLPIDTAIDLLAALGVPLPGGASPAELATDIADLQSTIAEARAEHTEASAELVAAVDQAQVDELTDEIAALVATIDAATAELAEAIDGILAGLDGAALLVLEDIDVRLIARAAGTVAASAALVDMSVGEVRVGTVSLGGIDVGATLAEVAAVADAVNTALSAVLGLVDPALEDLVNVQLLDRETSVSPGADGITAAASFAGLRVTVTPPSVCDLLTSLAEGQDPIDAVLDDLGVDLPALSTEVADVLSALGSTIDCTEVGGGVVSALSEPLRVEALSVSGSGFFSATTASVPVPTLPVTGGETSQSLVLALGGLGLGAGWLVRRSRGPLVRR